MERYELSPATFTKLRNLVYERAGISLAPTKHQLLQSRLRRRLRALDLSTFEEYYDLIASLPSEAEESIEFVNAVTTNKTDFFRESHHFDYFVRTSIPHFQNRGIEQIKVWHAGCSTGEEPYTLKIAFAESGHSGHCSLIQLATDIDTNVLKKAEAGVYEEERMKCFTEDRKRMHFLKGKGSQEGSFRIKPSLQENIVFRKFNLIQFPWQLKPTTRFDVIFCRNVLIYFDRETQSKIVQGFLDRLNPGGYLFLGHSESIQGMHRELRSLGQTMYQVIENKLALKRAA